MESVKSILELATSAKSLWIRKSAQERKEFLNMLLSNPILEGINVRFELKKPFAVLVNMSKKEDWCAIGDLNSYTLRHWHLKPACLPIPPTAHTRLILFIGLKHGQFI